jgi:hypothetical protein
VYLDLRKTIKSVPLLQFIQLECKVELKYVKLFLYCNGAPRHEGVLVGVEVAQRIL